MAYNNYNPYGVPNYYQPYQQPQQPQPAHGNSYARGRGRNAKRDSMGRYSRRYSMDRADMVDELRTMMDTAPDDRTRMELEKMISKIER